MIPERTRRQLAVAVALGALLLTASLLLPETWSGGSDGRTSIVPDLPLFFDVLLIALGVAVFLSVAIVLIALTLRRDPTQPVRRKGPGAALVVLVLGALAASLVATARRGDGFDRAPENVARVQEEPGGGGAAGADGSRPLGLLVAGAVALLVVGGPVVAWRFARARVPESIRAEAFDELLLAQVDEGIAELETVRDPRAAVIACYGRLQRLARWSGLEVRASDTSSELLEALSGRSAALEPSAARLVSLFQTARFSAHPMDEADRAEAIAALSEVRDRLVVRA